MNQRQQRAHRTLYHNHAHHTLGRILRFDGYDPLLTSEMMGLLFALVLGSGT